MKLLSLQIESKILNQMNIKVNINYVINKLNINDLKKVYDLFKNLNINFTLSQNLPSNMSYKKIYNRLTKQDLSKVNFIDSFIEDFRKAMGE